MTVTPRPSAATAQLGASAGVHSTRGDMRPGATLGLRGASVATLLLAGLLSACDTPRSVEGPSQTSPRAGSAQPRVISPAAAPAPAAPAADSVAAAPMARTRTVDRLAKPANMQPATKMVAPQREPQMAPQANTERYDATQDNPRQVDHGRRRLYPRVSKVWLRSSRSAGA